MVREFLRFLVKRRRRTRWELALTLVFLVSVVGVLGYVSLVPDMGVVEAIYQTIITMTNTGYSDLADAKAEHSPLVMVFTTGLLVFGFATVTLAFAVLTSALVEGELRHAIGLHRAKRRVRFMKDHYIVCGYGRMGEIIADALREEKIPVVVIETDQQRRDDIEEKGLACIIGDATHDDILQNAAIEKARGLIAVTNSDPENLFITLSARQMNPKLLIVSRAASANAETKILRAGANRVILPYKLGAHQLAQAALRPNVIDFIEIATRTTNLDMAIEEICVDDAPALEGKSLREASVLRDQGLIVIGIKPASDGAIQFNPPADTVISARDILITMGSRKSLENIHTSLK